MPDSNQAVIQLRMCSRWSQLDNFFDSSGLLSWLSESTINAFLYNGTRTEGISSVTDWAIAVDVPLGISSAPMFRHINSLASNVNLDQLSFKNVIDSYPSSLDIIKKDWASCNFCKKLESIIERKL